VKIKDTFFGSIVFPILFIVTCDFNWSVLLEFVVIVRSVLDGLLLGQFFLILFFVDIYEILGDTISLRIKWIIMNILKDVSF
jgi:hypothetical protein